MKQKLIQLLCCAMLVGCGNTIYSYVQVPPSDAPNNQTQTQTQNQSTAQALSAKSACFNPAANLAGANTYSANFAVPAGATKVCFSVNDGGINYGDNSGSYQVGCNGTNIIVASSFLLKDSVACCESLVAGSTITLTSSGQVNYGTSNHTDYDAKGECINQTTCGGLTGLAAPEYPCPSARKYSLVGVFLGP